MHQEHKLLSLLPPSPPCHATKDSYWAHYSPGLKSMALEESVAFLLLKFCSPWVSLLALTARGLELHFLLSPSCNISFPGSTNSLFQSVLFAVWFCKEYDVSWWKIQMSMKSEEWDLRNLIKVENLVPICVFDLNVSREPDSQQSHSNVYSSPQQILCPHYVLGTLMAQEIVIRQILVFALFT